jgi:hypothetical protein
VGRFHQDEAITASTLSTLAVQSGREKGEEGEKADDVYTSEHTESPSPQAKPVHMMDEKFEMSEVIRGTQVEINMD